MITVIGFHHAGVPGLAAGIKAPVVEGGHHLALINLLVQAAIGLRAAVNGVFLGKLGKGILGSRARLPLSQKVLGLCLGVLFQLGLLFVISVLALRDLAGFGLEKDVTHVYGLIVLTITLTERHHIIGRVVLVGQNGGVPGLTTAVKQPIHQHAGGIGTGLAIGIGHLVVVLGQIGHTLSGLETGVQLVRGLLGRFQRGGTLLLGGIHTVSVGIRGALGGAADADALIVHHIVGVPVGGVFGLQLLVRIGQAIVMALGKVAGQNHTLHLGLVNTAAHGCAVNLLEVFDNTQVGSGGSGFKRLVIGVKLCLHGVVPDVALFLRLVVQRVDGRHLVNRLADKIIKPGLRIIAGIGLRTQVLAGVQPHVGNIRAVLLDKVLIDIYEIVV